MILECLKCHKEFETENRYKSYCYECDGKKKVVIKIVKEKKTCPNCGETYTGDKCRNCIICSDCGKLVIRTDKRRAIQRNYCEECARSRFLNKSKNSF